MQQKISFQTTYFYIFYQERNDDSGNYENVEIHNVLEGQKQTYIYTFCQHIFLFSLSKPDLTAIFVHAVWISILDIKVLLLSHPCLSKSCFHK